MWTEDITKDFEVKFEYFRVLEDFLGPTRIINNPRERKIKGKSKTYLENNPQK